MSKFISVGKILNFHGIKGEAKVGFSKGQEDFLLSLDIVYVKNGSEYLPLEIEYSRLNKSVALIKFKDIDSINDIIPYKGQIIFVEEATIREKLDEDEFLIDELVGLSVDLLSVFLIMVQMTFYLSKRIQKIYVLCLL